MATQTPNIGLVKPARGEFTGTWDIPVNGNSDILDTQIGSINAQLTAAQGTASSLAARLAISLDGAGNLLPSPEIIAARNSTIYGDFATLGPRLSAIDVEVFNARQGSNMLIDSLAFNAAGPSAALASSFGYKNDCVLSAPVGFLTFTGADVYVNGSVTPIYADINGYRQVVSSQISTTVSGGAGTYYVYLQRSPGGQTFLTETGTGSVTADLDSNLTVLNDISVNFVTSGVQAGFLLQITSVGSQNLGTYVISSVGYNSNPNNLQIIGDFTVAQGALNYTIISPLAPTLGFTGTVPAKRFAPVSNQIFIGQAVFDGTNVTSVLQYALKGHYEGFTSVSLTSGNYSLTVPHNLGYVPTNVKFYASQASDFSQKLEILASDAISAGTQSLQRSAITAFDGTNVYLKNATNGIFYQDFSGTSQTSGYVFVVVDR